MNTDTVIKIKLLQDLTTSIKVTAIIDVLIEPKFVLIDFEDFRHWCCITAKETDIFITSARYTKKRKIHKVNT